MPHRPSARKTTKQDAKRHLRNKAVKSRLKTETRKFERAVERGDAAQASGQLSLVTRLLQKAAAKGVLPDNTAARRQQRLQKDLNTITAAPQ